MHSRPTAALALLPATRSEAQAHTTRGVSGGATGAAAAAGAPASRLFAMDNFIDKTTAEGRFDFSEWVRAYGKYLDEQVRQVGLWAMRQWLDLLQSTLRKTLPGWSVCL